MLQGWEWLIIGIVAIIIIMWGPSKIPELAKALGKAKGEFSKASKEFDDAAKNAENAPPAKTQKQTKTKEELLLETARSLGIETNGKTKEEIAEEVEKKIKQLGSD